MALAAKESDLICCRCSLAFGSSAGGLVASRYVAAVYKAPAAVLGTGIPASSYVKNDFCKLRVSAYTSSSGRHDILDHCLPPACAMELMDSCLLRALEALVCFLRFSSTALSFCRCINSC